MTNCSTQIHVIASTDVKFYAITGLYNLPVTCLIEPSPEHPVRSVDKVFVQHLMSKMLKNQITEVAHMIGLLTLVKQRKLQQTPA